MWLIQSAARTAASGGLGWKGEGRGRRAFTLIELLVVTAIIGLLALLVVTGVQNIIDSAQVSSCSSNLHQIGAAIFMYAGDHEGTIPYGPKAPPFTSPSDLYPSTGAPTSLISLATGQPAALGLLLDPYLAKTPKALFCPGCDKPMDAAAQLAKVGHGQAQCSYYYRHAGNTQLFDPPGFSINSSALKLGNLGVNSKGAPVRALVMDTIFLAPSGLESFKVTSISNHHQKLANILFSDGHVITAENTNGRFTIDVQDYSALRSSFSKILQAFEAADEMP